eukprot:scaffold13528_cov169-Amphora_coffeaeformis.AAC.13
MVEEISKNAADEIHQLFSVARRTSRGKRARRSSPITPPEQREEEDNTSVQSEIPHHSFNK